MPLSCGRSWRGLCFAQTVTGPTVCLNGLLGDPDSYQSRNYSDYYSTRSQYLHVDSFVERLSEISGSASSDSMASIVASRPN